MRAHAIRSAWRALPEVRLGVVAAGGVLVLAPHQDDECLGCGGLIALLCEAGTPPAILFVTDGAGSHPGSALFPPERLRSIRAEEAITAAALLGLGRERVRLLALPDGAAPVAGQAFDAAVAAIRRTAAEFGCATIAAPWRHDPHCDHQAAAAMAAATGLRVLSYPVWGWLLPDETALDDAWASGHRLAVGQVLDRKRRALAAHRSQFGEVVTDDPNGFRVPAALLAACLTPFEFFLDGAV